MAYDENAREWKTAQEMGVPEGYVIDDGKGDKMTNLARLIQERQELVEGGLQEDHETVKAYDAKTGGTEVDTTSMSLDNKIVWASSIAAGGKWPPLGRGKAAVKLRTELLDIAGNILRKVPPTEGLTISDNSHMEDQPTAPDQAGQVSRITDAGGVVTSAPIITAEQSGLDPLQAGRDLLGNRADVRASRSSITKLDNQLSTMTSFVTNLNHQVDRMNELAKDLAGSTSNIRLLNKPIRKLKGKVIGSALQAKWETYLKEVSLEIGKLSSGSTGSVAELSVGAQEKWDKIHDPNLSVVDMLDLLTEIRGMANIRLNSVKGAHDDARTRLRNPDREYVIPEAATAGLENNEITPNVAELSNEELLSKLSE